METNNKRYVFTGDGYDAQLSYMLNKDMALALRYSYVKPHDDISNKYGIRSDYSLGFTKFIFGNKVKLQSDLTFSEEEIPNLNTQQILMFRMNMILSL